MNDVNSLSHTSWNCKYHVVFAPKYRRKVFFGEKRREIGSILRTLCNWKGIKIIEAEVCPDHIHMLIEIPPKIAVASFMGYLKGKSGLMLYEKFPELKYKYRNREFWCRGYYVDTAGKNAKKIQEYEGHLLSKEMLEEIRFLLNYRMDSENPLALILAGQTELWEKLKLHAYRAILHRVDIQCFLAPYDFSQTKAYIEKQLAYAGHSNAIFSEDALKVIHSFSSGIPRLINRACTQSLVYAYQNRRPIVDDRMVQLVLVGEVS